MWTAPFRTCSEVDVAGDDPRCVFVASAKLDTVLALERRDILLGEPYRDLDGDGDAVVGEHKLL